MNVSEIEKLLGNYIKEKKQQGCFLIKGEWGVGKTYFINDYIAKFEKISKEQNKHIKFVTISLFDKKDISQIASEINSKLISAGGKLLEKILEIPKGISALSAGINFDLTALMSENNRLEKHDSSKECMCFIFDDLERTSIDLKDALGYINNFNENYGVKVVVLANTDEIKDSKDREVFEQQREKVFCTEALFNESFNEIAKTIISSSNLGTHQLLILNLFSNANHTNLRTLIYAIQKIEQISSELRYTPDDDVLAGLIGTIIRYSIERASKSVIIPAEESDEDKNIREVVAMLTPKESIYDMDFIKPFVYNEDYSIGKITSGINEKQRYAVENKGNPIPKLIKEWDFADDDEYRKIIDETKKWIEDNKIIVSEYPNIIRAIGEEAFARKLDMFCDADEYLNQIFELMKANLQKTDQSDLDSIIEHRSSSLEWRDSKGCLDKLKVEIERLQENKLKQAVDCNALFNIYNETIDELLRGLAYKDKDVLEICTPDIIVERIKREKDLQVINNARCNLWAFYRSHYPKNIAGEQRRAELQKNSNAKLLIEQLNNYLNIGELSKSKRFLIGMMIKNLDGTYF